MDIEIGVEKYYTSQLLEDNPTSLFVFGDNNMRIGKGGQAIIRYKNNAIGIVTKMTVNIYLSDNNLEKNKTIINADIDLIKEKAKDYKKLIFPKDGLGTGLADLKNKAPKTYKFLRDKLIEEFEYDNNSGEILTEYIDNTEVKTGLDTEQIIYILTQNDVNYPINTSEPLQVTLPEYFGGKLIDSETYRHWTEHDMICNVNGRFFQVITASSDGDMTAWEKGFDAESNSIIEMEEYTETKIIKNYRPKN